MAPPGELGTTGGRGMRKRWIFIGLIVGLLAVAISGGVALAWGGSAHGWGWGRGDHEERQSAVAAKVAEILGTEADETADAIAQAQEEVREEAADAALEDVAGRVAETLGTDADATAEALRNVSEEMFDEALESKLQDAIDDGRITEERAQEIRDSADSYGGWLGFGYGHKGGDSDEFASRVAEELDVDSDDVADAIEQALTDIRTESLEEKLQAAIDSGRITEEEADEIREKINSGDWNGFGKRGVRGHHDGNGRRGHGRGRHANGDSGADPTATPETPSGDNST